MTGKGTGAIATIQLSGGAAQVILQQVFKPAGSKPAEFRPGRILLGTIDDGDQTIDQVTIGCEAANRFAINCHGNPLIVEMIMQLLRRCGAELVTAEQLIAAVVLSEKPPSTIHVEAKLALLRARTVSGAKVLANQTETGLFQKATQWLRNIDILSPGQIAAQAEQTLQESQRARLIIFGCTAVLAGPPNTGKSTLLNYLSGRQKAIVTNIAGTTRDWVSAQIQIEPLALTLIDTAGLVQDLGTVHADAADTAAQAKTRQIVQRADLVLLVLDNNRSSGQLDESLLKIIAGKKVLTILNKSDLPVRFDPAGLPDDLRDIVLISAKFGTGIKELTEKICQVCNVDKFDLKTPVCFTERQENLLQQLTRAESKQREVSVITELLKGPLGV